MGEGSVLISRVGDYVERQRRDGGRDQGSLSGGDAVAAEWQRPPSRFPGRGLSSPTGGALSGSLRRGVADALVDVVRKALEIVDE